MSEDAERMQGEERKKQHQNFELIIEIIFDSKI